MLDTFMKFADSGDLGCSTKIDGVRKNREWHRTETIEPYDYDPVDGQLGTDSPARLGW
jgi:hypothetical protein